MNDYCIEQLIKKKNDKKDFILLVIIGAAIVVAAVLSLKSILFVPILAVLVAGGIVVFMGKDVEFEYLYVNGDFDVDKIIQKRKRKSMISISLDEVEIVAPIDNEQLKGYRFSETVDYSSRSSDARLYAMIFRHSNKIIKLIFEPNDEMLEGMWMKYPSKIKK